MSASIALGAVVILCLEHVRGLQKPRLHGRFFSLGKVAKDACQVPAEKGDDRAHVGDLQLHAQRTFRRELQNVPAVGH